MTNKQTIGEVIRQWEQLPPDPPEPSIVVLGSGRVPNDVMLIGEMPGETESRTGVPFTGASGKELSWYLSRYNLSHLFFYCTNVCKTYIPGNPDPTPTQIEQWTPFLEAEIEQCNPKLIIAVGRYSTQWFLGPDISIGKVHGIPHLWKDSITVLPVIHPASGLYDKDMKAAIMWDFSQVPKLLDCIKYGKPIQYRHDEYEGKEDYRDVTGAELIELLIYSDGILGLDTEGYTDNPFSIQLSPCPGVGYMLRHTQPDFRDAILVLQSYVDRGYRIVIHNTMYDIPMCRVMGLDLFEADIVDTMMMIHTIPYLRVKSQPVQNLEFASYRWCGMKVMSHDELVSELGTERQIQYLNQVLELDIPKPEPRVELKNDGTIKTTRPWHVHRLAKGILKDIKAGKVDKDGNLTNPLERWNGIHKSQRKPVEKLLGKMPFGSVGAVFERDQKRATDYGCRDSDACLRLYYALLPEIPQ